MAKKDDDDTGIDDSESEIEIGGDVPSKAEIDSQLREHSMFKADMDQARGEIGALVKNGETDHNIHRKAFKQLVIVKNMDESKRSEYLTHLLIYLGYYGLVPHPDLFENDGAKRLAAIARKDFETLSEPEGEIN